jgi:hypothetical protein
MDEKSFILQRYASGNWQHLRGRVPFLATGPNFFGWAIKGSLARCGEHRFVPTLQQELQAAYGDLGEEMARYTAAWALLQTGIVQALWVGHSPISESSRWERSVEQLSKEIPRDLSLGEGVIEYLSGLSDPGHFRSYVGEDQIELVSLTCPIS